MQSSAVQSADMLTCSQANCIVLLAMQVPTACSFASVALRRLLCKPARPCSKWSCIHMLETLRVLWNARRQHALNDMSRVMWKRSVQAVQHMNPTRETGRMPSMSQAIASQTKQIACIACSWKGHAHLKVLPATVHYAPSIQAVCIVLKASCAVTSAVWCAFRARSCSNKSMPMVAMHDTWPRDSCMFSCTLLPFSD